MADPVELHVRGGRGGITARLEDIEHAGRLLRTVAEALAVHGRTVLGVSLDPRLHLTALHSPLTFARAEAALTAAALGPDGLLPLAGMTEILGCAALTVAAEYRTADALAAGSLRVAASLAGRVNGRAIGAFTPVLLLGAATSVTVVRLIDAAVGVDGGADGAGSADGAAGGVDGVAG